MIYHRRHERQCARQIDGALFHRATLNPPKVSTALRELLPGSDVCFKDAYLFEFLNLPADHSETDLHRSLLNNLGRFLTELGRDFCYIRNFRRHKSSLTLFALFASQWREQNHRSLP